MSVDVMGAVFKVPLPPSEKLVALALADHAHDDGTEARPGMASLAIKTTLSKRQVQRVLKSLVLKGVIEEYKPSTYTTPAWYRFILDRHGNLANFSQPVPIDNLSTGYRHPGSEGVTPVTRPVDTGVTQSIKNRHRNKTGSEFSPQPPPVDISVYERMREERSVDGAERARQLRRIALGNLEESSG